MNCHQCGLEIPDNSKFCPNCGAENKEDKFAKKELDQLDIPKKAGMKTYHKLLCVGVFILAFSIFTVETTTYLHSIQTVNSKQINSDCPPVLGGPNPPYSEYARAFQSGEYQAQHSGSYSIMTAGKMERCAEEYYRSHP